MCFKLFEGVDIFDRIIVNSCSKKSTRITPSASQNAITITFIWKVFFLRKVVWYYSIVCLYDSGYKNWTHFLPSVTFFLRNYFPSKLKGCKCLEAIVFVISLFSSVNILGAHHEQIFECRCRWIISITVPVLKELNVTQFICFYLAVTTNDFMDSLNVAWRHYSYQSAALLFINQWCLPFSLVTAMNSWCNYANIHCYITIYIFQPFMNMNGYFNLWFQEFNNRMLPNMYVDIIHFAKGCSTATRWLESCYCRGLEGKVWEIAPN